MKILAIGAHPDDIEVGCGGLLQKFQETKILLMSNGQQGGPGHIRVEEAKAAAELLKSKLEVYEFLDTKIDQDLAYAIRKIEAEIKNMNPDMVLTMTSRDTHQDHRAVFEATRVASRSTPCTVLSYLGPSSAEQFSPTWFVPLTEEEMELKLQAIECHRTQAHRDYLNPEHIINTAKYWANVTRSGYEYVEPYELIKYWEKL